MTDRNRMGLVAALLAVGLLAAGCDLLGRRDGPTPPPAPTVTDWDESRDADELWDQATDLLEQADSVRLVGRGTDPEGDFEIVHVGEDSHGFVQIEKDGDVESVEWLVVGRDVYFNATDEFWADYDVAEDVIAQISSRWVSLDPEDPGMDWVADVSGRTYTVPSVSGELSYVGLATVEGQPAWEFTDSDDASYFFAATGDPYLLRIENEGTTSGVVQMRFLEYGDVTEVIAAPRGEILDYSDYTGDAVRFAYGRTGIIRPVATPVVDACPGRGSAPSCGLRTCWCRCSSSRASC